MKRALLCALLLLLTCCGKSHKPTYRVGVDQLWYPLVIPGKELNVLGFSTDLLQEIAQLKNLQIVLVYMSWDNLLSGLTKGQYDAALSSLRPYNFNEKQYSFSDLYIMTGPVLVVPISSPASSLTELDGMEIGFPEGSQQDARLNKESSAIPRAYGSIPEALNSILIGALEGALVDYLAAWSYCRDLYHGQLKIVTSPLNDAGLRLITKYENTSDLMKAFNEGLKELKKNGRYNALAAKWSLPPA